MGPREQRVRHKYVSLMIEDKNERTRAILWMLQDVDPSMPIGQALGYLKAVEAELTRQERAKAPWIEAGHISAGHISIGGSGLIAGTSSKPLRWLETE